MSRFETCSPVPPKPLVEKRLGARGVRGAPGQTLFTAVGFYVMTESVVIPSGSPVSFPLAPPNTSVRVNSISGGTYFTADVGGMYSVEFYLPTDTPDLSQAKIIQTRSNNLIHSSPIYSCTDNGTIFGSDIFLVQPGDRISILAVTPLTIVSPSVSSATIAIEFVGNPL